MQTWRIITESHIKMLCYYLPSSNANINIRPKFCTIKLYSTLKMDHIMPWVNTLNTTFFALYNYDYPACPLNGYHAYYHAVHQENLINSAYNILVQTQ